MTACWVFGYEFSHSLHERPRRAEQACRVAHLALGRGDNTPVPGGVDGAAERSPKLNAQVEAPLRVIVSGGAAWHRQNAHAVSSGTGQVRISRVTSCPSVVLHAWLEAELPVILDWLAPPKLSSEDNNRAASERWQAGLAGKPTLLDRLPPLRMLLVMDNLAGHLTGSFLV